MNLLLLIGLDMLGLLLITVAVGIYRNEGRSDWPYFVPTGLIGATIFAGALIGILGGIA